MNFLPPWMTKVKVKKELRLLLTLLEKKSTKKPKKQRASIKFIQSRGKERQFFD